MPGIYFALLWLDWYSEGLQKTSSLILCPVWDLQRPYQVVGERWTKKPSMVSQQPTRVPPTNVPLQTLGFVITSAMGPQRAKIFHFQVESWKQASRVAFKYSIKCHMELCDHVLSVHSHHSSLQGKNQSLDQRGKQPKTLDNPDVR